MATGVAGHGQFRAVRLEPSSYSAGSSWPACRDGLHAGSSKGGALPQPVAGEQRWVQHRPEWEESQEAWHGPLSTWAAPAQRSWGGRPGASPLGQTPHSLEHPASAACFLVWVLGKDGSRSVAPAVCSPPSLTPQWPSPWCSPSCGCLLFMGPPLPSAPPAAPPLRVVPSS